VTTYAAPPSIATPCPTCGYPQVTVGDEVPWCASCGWNLDRHDPGRPHFDFGWSWVDRWAFRTAYRLNSEQYAALSGRPVTRPALGAAGWFTMVIGLVMAAFIAASAAAGVWLCTLSFPSLALVPGVTLIALAIVLLPLPRRVDRHAHEITREQAPTLWRLVDEVADAVGTKRAHRVVVDQAFNAYVHGYGWRRRVVGLGVPLWGSLGPQQRVALLGHEFGQYVNGDIRRGPITGLAFSTLYRLSRVLRPSRAPGVRRSLVQLIVRLVEHLLLGTLSSLCRLGQMGIIMIGLRGTQRAEYYADDIAARTAGTDGAVRLLDVLTNRNAHTMLVRMAARQRRPVADWQRLAADTAAELRPTLLARRQLTHRTEAAIFASHPPNGMRASLVQSRPGHTARVVLSAADSARIDDELATPYTRYMKDVTLS
jgi:heat shock protein HtpX